MSKKAFIPVMGNRQALDGGAMFGNVPKAMWSTWMSADEANRVTLATRALLVKESRRNILFETGIGAYMSPKLKDRFGVFEPEHVLLNSLANVGLTHEQIDVVVLSHLHFDHAGGLLSAYQDNQTPDLLFPNAQFVISEEAWNRANQPHARDRASFVPELMVHLNANRHRVHLISHTTCEILGEDYRLYYSDGHTPGLLITEIMSDERHVFFVSDLIPAAAWVHVPVTMGYDRSAELVIDEKKALLDRILAVNGEAFFTHDPDIAFASIEINSQGKYIPKAIEF